MALHQVTRDTIAPVSALTYVSSNIGIYLGDTEDTGVRIIQRIQRTGGIIQRIQRIQRTEDRRIQRTL